MSKDKFFSSARNIAVVLILFVAVVAYLFTGNPTGWQVLKAQDGWYLATMLAFFAAGVYAIWRGIASYQKTQEAKSFRPAFIVFAIFCAIAFGKGCTDKTNSGVTAPSGRIETNR